MNPPTEGPDNPIAVHSSSASKGEDKSKGYRVALLTVALASLVVSNGDLIPVEINLAGFKFEKINPDGLRACLLLVNGFLTIAFSITAAGDLLQRYSEWIVSRRGRIVVRRNEPMSGIERIAESWRHEVTHKHEQRLDFLRGLHSPAQMVVDFALPLTLGCVAIVSLTYRLIHSS